ncbi:uncharacterized protein PITG_21024 [Phytophthora infestans T30-4]|uniref:Uncharacterized protein n=1 Tax=Phytophthora infestans (strain T30-4) TaxID=403677 RepID=D0P3P4_PHYIT|nr:uncharacterized protein PITG_21024 [Phytophthora infestans T30-4]EEY60482.1 conserved hypothetical protein [Phytophthora infestans T30-4]|eukprot:XP_002895079.1 conserved hypothetical protein [Phytophthora infestans T30-4]
MELKLTRLKLQNPSLGAVAVSLIHSSIGRKLVGPKVGLERSRRAAAEEANTHGTAAANTERHARGFVNKSAELQKLLKKWDDHQTATIVRLLKIRTTSRLHSKVDGKHTARRYSEEYTPLSTRLAMETSSLDSRRLVVNYSTTSIEMLSSKILAVFAVATLATADDYTTDDYITDGDEGSSYIDDGSFDYSALPAYTYTFDPEYSAGVSGTINVQYGGPFSTFAVITTDLDFSDVDQSEIMAFDGNCTEEVTEYKWHIHVKWPHDYDSESFEQCGLAITGNHYDPLKACGPNSEFVGTSTDRE